MFMTNEYGYERAYIHGHNAVKDMSDRICSICKTHETSKWLNGRPQWYLNEQRHLICNKCYNRTNPKRQVILKEYRRSQRNKDIQKRYCERNKERIKSYCQRPEVKQRMRERNRKKHNIPPERYRV